MSSKHSNLDIEPLLDSFIVDLTNDESIDISTSEQEIIEQEFIHYFQTIKERFQAAIEDIQQSTSDGYSIDSEATPIDIPQLVISEIVIFEEKAFKEISNYLDVKFTKFRRSFQAYKKKTIDKLFRARQSINEYKKAIELSIKQSAEINTRNKIEQIEISQSALISDLTSSLSRYKSAYEMSSNKGTTLELEKVELLEKISRLETRAIAAEDRASRVCQNLYYSYPHSSTTLILLIINSITLLGLSSSNSFGRTK